MQVPEKLDAVGFAHNPTARLTINDKGYRFLIDSGATISAVPVLRHKRTTNDSTQKAPTIYAVNGTPIRTFGTTTITLSLGLRRQFTWEFVIADIDTAIIGCDFLAEHDLHIDLKNAQLIDNTTGIATSGAFDRGKQTISLLTVPFAQETWVEQLLLKYPETTNPTNKKLLNTRCKHVIITNGHPVFNRPRRLTGEKLNAAKEHFQELVKKGVVSPSSSCWSSPIHMVKKNNGDWRIVGDYRQLNTITVPDRFPVPYMSDFRTIL